MAVILAIPVYADDESANEEPACDKAAVVQSGLSEINETEPVTEKPDAGDPEMLNTKAENEDAAEDIEEKTEQTTDTDIEEVNQEKTTAINNDVNSSPDNEASDNRTEEDTTVSEDKPDVPLLRPSSWAAVFEAPGY